MFVQFRAECRRIVRDRVYLSLLTLLPVVSLLFFTLYFHNLTISKLPVVVVDYDQSSLSRKLLEMIAATESVSVTYGTYSTTEALTLIESGRAYAAVVIPADFESRVMEQQAVSVALYNSGTNISTNGFIEKAVRSTVTTFGAAVELQSGVAMADIMPISLTTRVLFNPELSYAAYLAPCFMPMMITIFTLLATLLAVAERKCKKLSTLAARCLPVTLSMSVLSAVMLALLFCVLKLPCRGSILLVAAATLLLVLSYQAVAILFAATIRSRHLALSVGGGFSVIAFTLSGLTFPTIAMSPVLQAASRLFPFTYYMEIVVDQLLRGAPVEYSAADIGALSLFLLIPPIVYRRL